MAHGDDNADAATDQTAAEADVRKSQQSQHAIRRPRDAATLVIVDRTSSAPRILMGRRRPEQVFLPNTFVFPGGRVEAADRAAARCHTLSPADLEALKIEMRGRRSDTRAAALALAAVRETYEETGFILGAAHTTSPPPLAPAWDAFHAEGYQPRLDKLTFFARAVTPPGRPRRYDTRFFIVDAGEICHRVGRTDGELLDIDWYALDRARTLKLPSITKLVIEDVAQFLDRERDMQTTSGVPFYYHRYGRQERALLRR